MLKTEFEMKEISISQIGKSACGPTAVLNILSILNYSNIPTKEELLNFFPARTRNYKTKNLREYLLSRIRAGTIHSEIIECVEKITNKSIIGKFFVIDQYMQINKFEEFLYECFSKKIAMMFTENLFILGNDAWHHQSCYGINLDKHLLYLTNPIESVPTYQVLKWISSGQWMIIPKDHLIDKVITEEDLKEFSTEKWDSFSISRQLYFLLKKNDKKADIFTEGFSRYQDLTIPYGGIGGISMFYEKDNLEAINYLKEFRTEKYYLPFYDKEVEISKI